MSSEQNTKSDAVDRSRLSQDQSASVGSPDDDKTRAISRQQRSDAAKRGWVTRKKRKP
jgi:hypothetical protein